MHYSCLLASWVSLLARSNIRPWMFSRKLSIRSDYPLFFGSVEYPKRIFNSVSFLIWSRSSTESGQYPPPSGCQLVASKHPYLHATLCILIWGGRRKQLEIGWTRNTPGVTRGEFWFVLLVLPLMRSLWWLAPTNLYSVATTDNWPNNVDTASPKERAGKIGLWRFPVTWLL